MKLESQDKCLEHEDRRRKTDSEVKSEIERLMSGRPIEILQSMEGKRRNEILRAIKDKEGISLRQISRVTGLSLDIVYKA